MKTGWYKGVNPRLDRLTSLLGSSKPSHGYTISEKGPEVVTAPGVYFPAEKGEVIPLRPRAEGGEVEPISTLHKDNDRAKLEMVHKIIGHIKPAGLEHRTLTGMTVQPESMKIEQSKYDILKSALSLLRPPAKEKAPSAEKGPEKVKLTPRQDGGEVSPDQRFGKPDLFKRLTEASGSFDMSPSISPASSQGFGKPDLFKRLTAASGSYDMTPSTPMNTPADQSNNPLDKIGTYLRQLTTMFSRADGGEVVPPEDELARLRRAMTVSGTTLAGEEMARARVSEQPFQPSTPEGAELAAREMWATPGVPQGMLAAATNITNPGNQPGELIPGKGGTLNIVPGFQKSYYDVHPEEKLLNTFKEAGASPKDATAALSKIMAVSEKTGPAPHLVQNANGEYVWATPGGIMPAGIMGKGPVAPKPGAPHPRTTEGGTLTSDPANGATMYTPPGGGTAVPYNAKVHGEQEVPGVLSNEDAAIYARKIVNGEMTPSQLRLVVQPFGAAGGQTKAKIWKNIEATNPNFNIKLAEAEYSSDTKALEGLSRLYTTASVAMGAAENHAKDILGLSAKVDRTGSPVINRWYLGGKKSIAGDKDVTSLDVAVHAFDREFSRYLTSMTQSGQMHQTEANEMSKLISSAQNPTQLQAAIGTATQLMQGKKSAFQDQFARLKDQLGGQPSGGGGGGGKIVTERRKTQDGRTLVKYSDGTIAEEK